MSLQTSLYSNGTIYPKISPIIGSGFALIYKRKGEITGEKFVQKTKGAQGLNAFKLDALVRFGYSHWGVFASYSLLPLFDTDKTIAVYPLSFGLSINI